MNRKRILCRVCLLLAFILWSGLAVACSSRSPAAVCNVALPAAAAGETELLHLCEVTAGV